VSASQLILETLDGNLVPWCSMIPYLAFSAIAAFALIYFALKAARTSNIYFVPAVAMFTAALAIRLVRGSGDHSAANWAVDVGALLYGFAFVFRGQRQARNDGSGVIPPSV
jgi:hypothetical protein